MIRLLFCIAFAFSFQFLAAQNRTVSNRVIDENSNPIPYANVYLSTPGYGSTTNVEGKFSFSFPTSVADDTVYISSIGYHVLAVNIREVNQSNPLILKQYVKTFDEVTVSEKRPDPYEILHKAFSHTRFNYPDSTYNLNLL